MSIETFTVEDMLEAFWGGVRYGQDGILRQMGKDANPVDFPEWIEKYLLQNTEEENKP